MTFEWTYAWHIHHGAKQQRGHLVHGVVGVCSTHMQVFDTLGCNFTECAVKNERQSWVAEWIARCSKLLSALLAVFDKNLGITGVRHTYFGRHPGQLYLFSLLGCRYYGVHKTAKLEWILVFCLLPKISFQDNISFKMTDDIKRDHDILKIQLIAADNKYMNLTHCSLFTPYSDVDLGQHSLLPDGTKPFPEPMLIYHQWSLVAIIWGQFHRKCSRYLPLTWVWKLLI